MSFLAIGGLIVAGVIKHADNVIKGFAMGMSVALSTAAMVMHAMCDFKEVQSEKFWNQKWNAKKQCINKFRTLCFCQKMVS